MSTVIGKLRNLFSGSQPEDTSGTGNKNHEPQLSDPNNNNNNNNNNKESNSGLKRSSAKRKFKEEMTVDKATNVVDSWEWIGNGRVKNSKVLFQGVSTSDTKYQINDAVVLNGEGGRVYYGVIKKLFEDKNKEKKMEVLWFFTGNELGLSNWPSQELIASDNFCDVVPVNAINRKCHIVYLDELQQPLETWLDFKNNFFYHYQYSRKTCTFAIVHSTTTEETQETQPKKLAQNINHLEIWQQRFNQLKEFQKEHGHCNPTWLAHRQLYYWVYYVRQNGRAKYSPEQIAQLDEIGFVWNTKKKISNQGEQQQQQKQGQEDADSLLAHQPEVEHQTVQSRSKRTK